MDRRFKIITIALCVAYVAIIGGHLHRIIADFAYGVRIGFQEGRKSAENGSAVLSTAGTFFISLKPENGFHTFPTTLRNQLDRKPMKVEIEKMIVELSNAKEKLPPEWLIADSYITYISFVVLFVMIFIPVQTFRILRSITRDKIFDTSNISKLRSIGYALLAYYITGLVVTFIHYRLAAIVVEVEGYKLQIDWGNTTLVILGFVVLMFAEMLKLSVAMKEEQDLTV